MDALAENWYHSGKKPEDLYGGKIGEIMKEFRSWIKARAVWNLATMTLLWDFFRTSDIIFELRNAPPGLLQDIAVGPYKAKYVKNVERVKEYEKERNRMNLRALFLLETMKHRGIKWPGLKYRSEWSEIDAEICACFETQDPKFNARRQLEILEIREEIAAWHVQHAMRKGAEALCFSEGVIGGLDAAPHAQPTTQVEQFNQLVQKDPTDVGFLVPIDVSGLIPHPRPGVVDDFSSSYPPVPLFDIEKEPSDAEETAEDIALRIDNINTNKEEPKAEKKSKTKTRNTQRNKAKARAKEAAKGLNIAGPDENGFEKLAIDD